MAAGYLECVLAGLVRKIDATVSVVSVGVPDEIAAGLDALGGGAAGTAEAGG